MRNNYSVQYYKIQNSIYLHAHTFDNEKEIDVVIYSFVVEIVITKNDNAEEIVNNK